MRNFKLKALFLTAALVTGTIAVAEEATPTPAPPVLDTDDKKISYVIGTQIAMQLSDLEEIGINLDVELLVRALREGLAGESKVTEEQIDDAMRSLQMKAMAYQMEQQRQASSSPAAQAGAEAAEAFLAENGAKEGVVTTDSGLQYRVINSGDGETPGPNSRVLAHYTGRLTDGTKFDSSVDRGQPFEFSTAGGVIPGWIEAAQLMKEGDKWEVFIPPALAYGPRGQGPIPPNSVLVFELELLEVLD